MASKPNCDRLYRCGVCGAWDEPDFMTATFFGDICAYCVEKHGAVLADILVVPKDEKPPKLGEK